MEIKPEFHHEKMPRSRRAKQFMPFSALKGFDEALRRKEWEVETRQRLKDKIWQEKDPKTQL